MNIGSIEVSLQCFGRLRGSAVRGSCRPESPLNGDEEGMHIPVEFIVPRSECRNTSPTRARNICTSDKTSLPYMLSMLCFSSKVNGLLSTPVQRVSYSHHNLVAGNRVCTVAFFFPLGQQQYAEMDANVYLLLARSGRLSSSTIADCEYIISWLLLIPANEKFPRVSPLLDLVAWRPVHPVTTIHSTSNSSVMHRFHVRHIQRPWSRHWGLGRRLVP